MTNAKCICGRACPELLRACALCSCRTGSVPASKSAEEPIKSAQKLAARLRRKRISVSHLLSCMATEPQKDQDQLPSKRRVIGQSPRHPANTDNSSRMIIKQKTDHPRDQNKSKLNLPGSPVLDCNLGEFAYPPRPHHLLELRYYCTL